MKIINAKNVALVEVKSQKDLEEKIIGHTSQLVGLEKLKLNQKVLIDYCNAQVQAEVTLRGHTIKGFYIYYFRILSGKFIEEKEGKEQC